MPVILLLLKYRSVLSLYLRCSAHSNARIVKRWRATETRYPRVLFFRIQQHCSLLFTRASDLSAQ
jgi:hypothetical protein